MNLNIEQSIGPEIPPELRKVMDRYPCCMGVAAQGADFCTCWTPIFDLDQNPELDVWAPTLIQPKCCGDCAYRADSPEWADDAKREWLEGLPFTGGVFWCHQGMRRVVRWRHKLAPPDLLIPAGAGDYQPPIRAKRGYQASGAPALICGGWGARAPEARLALVLDELHKARLRDALGVAA